MNKNDLIANQKKIDSQATSLKENVELKSHTIINQYDCTIGFNQ